MTTTSGSIDFNWDSPSISDSKIIQMTKEMTKQKEQQHKKEMVEKYFSMPNDITTSGHVGNTIKEGEVLASMIYDKLDQLSEVLSEEEYEELEQQIMRVMK
jgi:hypothetical protein